ncbi:serine hydrolase domain-containing protein [Thermaurantimonas aggregans]|uniref:serine hydrolase domain-containing protein n=1 Tax=Thermaurantimonas aggregans TaxID=2173829 RepID=UPI0023F0C83E|nr:serine hydrolase [Thermaurantimonas aggregans]MCX8148115.1 beta-lactamase family protein [Thermaurantimonas aggregans]
MTRVKNVIIYTFLIAVVLVGLMYAFKLDYLIKGVRIVYLNGYKSSFIHDYLYFDRDTVYPAQQISELKYADELIQLPKGLDSLLEALHTASFLVIKDGKIVFEKYYHGFQADTVTNSFSMAKSVVTLLTQMAIQDGIIPSWNTPVKKYLPEIHGLFANQVTLFHLSAMCSGLEWDENYKNPFGVTAKAYYSDHTNDICLNQPFDSEPGKKFIYQSGNTQLLALALERATGKRISELLEEKLWKPLGMERSAYWHLDKKNGDNIAYCCINASTHDFARLGLLVLNNGRWNGEQLIDSAFLWRARQPFLESKYGQSFWLANEQYDEPIAYFRGHTGQYIIMLPKSNAVIVRTGYKTLPQSDGMHHDEFHHIVKGVKSLL